MNCETCVYFDGKYCYAEPQVVKTEADRQKCIYYKALQTSKK